MKKLAFSAAGLVLVAGAAHAQPADETHGPDAHDAAHAEAAAEPGPAAEPAVPADAAEPALPADASAAASEAIPAEPTVTAATVTEAEIESFAQATVKLQEIQADTALAPEQKQTAMVAAVTETGLDPAKYNAIGRAAQSDAELRAKVQTAMSKYAPASDQG